MARKKRIDRWQPDPGRGLTDNDIRRLSRVVDELRDVAHRNSYSVLDYSLNQAGNLAATSTVLFTTPIPADTLSRNGDSLDIRFTVRYAANANNKTLQLYLGPVANPVGLGTAILTVGPLAVNNHYATITSRLVRFLYNGCAMDFTINSTNATLAGTNSVGSATQNWQTDLALAVVGTGVLANDISMFMWHVAYLPTSVND